MYPLSQTTAWIYMVLALMALLAIFWNLFKKIIRVGKLSNLILTFCFSMFCLLIIGQVTVISWPELSCYSPTSSHHAVKGGTFALENPCTSFVLVLTALFMVTGFMFLIVFDEDIIKYLKRICKNEKENINEG